MTPVLLVFQAKLSDGTRLNLVMRRHLLLTPTVGGKIKFFVDADKRESFFTIQDCWEDLDNMVVVTKIKTIDHEEFEKSNITVSQYLHSVRASLFKLGWRDEKNFEGELLLD